jgi:hypothetical protein
MPEAPREQVSKIKTAMTYNENDYYIRKYLYKVFPMCQAAVCHTYEADFVAQVGVSDLRWSET